ncbi:MAG: hypothetical protein R2830_06475 [Saprospiraceae bacterium]
MATIFFANGQSRLLASGSSPGPQKLFPKTIQEKRAGFEKQE